MQLHAQTAGAPPFGLASIDPVALLRCAEERKLRPDNIWPAYVVCRGVFKVTTRKQWYFCPHRENFLVQGRHACRQCDPIPQEELVKSLPAPRLDAGLRAIFPIVNYSGTPLSPSATPLASS
jgi:hypothetical protein